MLTRFVGSPAVRLFLVYFAAGQVAIRLPLTISADGQVAAELIAKYSAAGACLVAAIVWACGRFRFELSFPVILRAFAAVSLTAAIATKTEGFQEQFWLPRVVVLAWALISPFSYGHVHGDSIRECKDPWDFLKTRTWGSIGYGCAAVTGKLSADAALYIATVVFLLVSFLNKNSSIQSPATNLSQDADHRLSSDHRFAVTVAATVLLGMCTKVFDFYNQQFMKQSWLGTAGLVIMILIEWLLLICVWRFRASFSLLVIAGTVAWVAGYVALSSGMTVFGLIFVAFNCPCSTGMQMVSRLNATAGRQTILAAAPALTGGISLALLPDMESSWGTIWTRGALISWVMTVLMILVLVFARTKQKGEF